MMRAMLLVWAGVCVVGWADARGEISHNMNTLSVTLQRDMADVMELVAVNYSEPVINTTYRASVEFDMRAMGPLYNSTHMVIDVIAHKQAYPPGIVSIEGGHWEVASPREQWRPLLAHYAGPTAVLVVALLLAASLPLAGLFWCCCYWCRVGRRRRPFDRKYDACIKGLLAIVFIALLTLFLFGVVCLFATDAQVESGMAEAPDSLRVGAADAREYLNATSAHARWLLVQNWRELAARLDAALLTSGVMVTNKLGEFSRAVSVTTLNNLVLKLDGVQADLRTVKNHTAMLRLHADRLNSGLRRVKKQLLDTLANCNQPKCIALQSKYNIGELNTEIHYSQMPDVTELLDNVTALLDSNIKAEVGAGQQVFRDIQFAIRRSVNEHIPSVQQVIAETGARLEALSNEISYVAGNLSVELKRSEELAGSLQELHSEYGPYRRYVGLAAALAPLLITCLFAWGLTCGVCGKRPDVYGASDCCNKGAGSKCLLCGVGVIFLVGGLMALVLAAYFTVGVGAQRFLCDPLTEPRNNRLMDDLEQFVDLEHAIFKERVDPDFNITYVLLHCHANFTIYKTLQLHRKYNIQGVRAELSRTVAERVAQLRPAFPAGGGATILRAGAKRKLTQLADTGLSDFDFERILHALESNMTSLALDSLAKQLDSTARSLSPALAPEAGELRRAADALRALLADVLAPMHHYTAQLNSTAIRLRDELRFNHKSLKEAIDFLIKETTEAEVFLNTQGPERLQNITQEYAAVITEKLNEYLDRVTYAAEHDVGRCGPLSNAFNATRDATCNKILMPTNGYWIALSWCVMLFIPLLVVAQRLARLYLHADPYPGPLVEAEYLYDAYADRDNVPLANAYKAEKRSGRGGRAREGEASGAPRGGAGAAAPTGAGGAARAHDLAPPVDAHHARRYNDMAPKHWEEGPPRYHGPTEYERPPPYYYPGPNDRQ